MDGVLAADPYGSDLFTEADGDPDTLANLGPLRDLAGVFEGRSGSDDHPVVDGSETEEFTERYELQPIDFQTNGPQLFYGLRYHTHITSPTEVGTFHDQVGYWLWEPAAERVVYTLSIPRGQALVAIGSASADAREFELTAEIGSEANGIVSNPFLLRGFRTRNYRISVSIASHGSWSYESVAELEIPGRDAPFRHLDRNTMHRVARPIPNPLAARVAVGGGLGIGSLRTSGNPWIT